LRNLDLGSRLPFKKGNCQLEAAGIAGTRTPSEAASNYQLGWFCLTPSFLRKQESSVPWNIGADETRHRYNGQRPGLSRPASGFPVIPAKAETQ
jgi:hypothetical protein